MRTLEESTVAPPSLADDIRMVLFFLFIFVGITMSLGLALALTSTPEPATLVFPVNTADGAVPLTRIFCDLPK